mgnify:CR=1 FL=1
MKYRLDIPLDRFPPAYMHQIEGYRRLGIDAIRFLPIAFEFFTSFGMPGLHPYRFLRERVFAELLHQQPTWHPDRLQSMMHSIVDHIGLVEQTVVAFLTNFIGDFDHTVKLAAHHGNTVAIYYSTDDRHGHTYLPRSALAP